MRFKVTGVVFPANMSVTCLVLSVREMRGLSRKLLKLAEDSAVALMARSSPSTFSRELVLEAAV